jgi:hypothetical protein
VAYPRHRPFPASGSGKVATLLPNSRHGIGRYQLRRLAGSVL